MKYSKYSRHPLSLALMTSVAAIATPALAQDTASGAAATDLDKVTVTGSRIARTGFVTSSPVTAISAEEIRSSGALNIGELMNKMPQLSPSYSMGNSTRYIGTAGLGLMDLRGMGPSRTLVLVNGRRHVGASPGSSNVDVNTIPTEWIERVEVITGGASAVYGADAVAGVVNFIMKKSFEGMELRGQTGQASEGGFDRSFVSFSGGSSFAEGRGNAAVAMEYSTQGRFNRGDRAIGREYLVSVPNPNFDSSKPASESNPRTVLSGPGGNHAISYGGTFNIGSFDYRNPNTYGNRYQFNADGSFRPQRYDGVVVSNSSCVDCDFADLNAVADLQPAFDRFSFNAIANFDLNDSHRLFVEAKYSKTESNFYGQPSFDQPIRIQRDNAYISPELGALMDAAGVSQLQVSRFNVDAGQRGELVERQTSRVVAGIEGFFGDNWSYEASANFGQTTIARQNLNNRINERFHAGLDAVVDANGEIVCRASIDPSAVNPHTGLAYSPALMTGCVPFSIMGDGAISPEAAAWFNTTAQNASKLQQTVLSASAANSSLFTLPAGDVGVAFGIEHRKEESKENTDALAALGLTFLNAIPSRGGEYSVDEVFAETTIPLLADLPGVNRLALDLAARHSDYSTAGETTAWNVGLDWEILSSLRFRGTLAQSVRAPGIGELFNGQSENFATVNDPCDVRVTNPNNPSTAKDPALRAANCAALGIPADYQVVLNSGTRPGLSGGNPNLKPEKAKSVSLGFVWQPEFIEGFGMSMDYWRITLEDAIGAVSAQTMATRCVDNPGGIDNQFCRSIQRAGNTTYVDAKGREFDAHSIYYWTALNENLAKSRRVGVDLEMDYRFGLAGGDANIRFVGTRMIQSREWAFQDFPDEFTEYVTYVTDPRWRSQISAGYKLGQYRASWDMTYVDGNLRVTPDSYNSNPGSASPIRNGSYTYHNLQLGYTFADSGVDVYMGVDNVFDKNPPRNYFGADLGSAYYDNIGRFIYMGATYKF